MVNIQLLRQELINDPLGLGYAPFLLTANDQAVANLLNNIDGLGVSAVNLETISKGDFIFGIVGGALALSNKDAVIQKKWDRFLSLISGIDTIRIGHPIIKNLLNLAISDGILTQDEIDGFVKRPGSRAEVLFGINTIITAEQVGAAR